MRLGLILCVLVISFIGFSSYAANQTCTRVPIKKENNNLILITNSPNKASLIYFLTNVSKKSIFVDHPTKRGVGAGWSSFLRPGHWSALIVGKNEFTIHCSTIEPGNVVTLDCAKVIYVCEPKNPTIKSSLKGSFWLIEDRSWENFVKTLALKGISWN